MKQPSLREVNTEGIDIKISNIDSKKVQSKKLLQEILITFLMKKSFIESERKFPSFKFGFPDPNVFEIFLKSSSITSTGYNHFTKVLFIKFQKGEVYKYEDVPKGVWHKLLLSPAPGRYGHQHIFHSFKYQKCHEPNVPYIGIQNFNKNSIQEKKMTTALVEEPIQAKDFHFDSLEAIRKRLLDLSGRNRLLNFKHGKKDSLRAIDELPDQVHELLINDNVVTFQAVPEPTREELIRAGYIQIDELTGEEKTLRSNPTSLEWAKVLGLNTNYNLPSPQEVLKGQGKHSDTKIQTLLFPYEMENIIRNIHSKAKTSLEETGTNILYISIGFLKWTESESSDISRLAPLYLIPVKLEKGHLDEESSTYTYTLQYTGDDIIANLSLREKLKVDFGIALPELDEDESPENYMAKVKKVISKKKAWEVKRFASLSLLNFSKLLMYLDLDPSRWPEGDKNISQHPLVEQFFGAKGGSKNDGFSEEYEIDRIEQIHDKFPLIDNADSSQHSALVDVIKGQNVVIEGPPGTGKSQTITNIIAAAMAQGKKVLFVAEKMAALDVVKQRLDNAQLGDFCLELHSHKTNKKQVFESVAQTLSLRSQLRPPAELKKQIQRYEKFKENLEEYANLINLSWKETGYSIHDILMGATRRREEFGNISSYLKLEALNSDDFNGTAFDDKKEAVKLYGHAYNEMVSQLGIDKDINDHPWFGIGEAQIQRFDLEEVFNNLEAWTSQLSELDNFLKERLPTVGIDYDEISSFEKQNMFFDDVLKLPDLSGREDFELLINFNAESLNDIQNYLVLYDKLSKTYQKLSKDLPNETLFSKGNIQDNINSLEALHYWGVSQELKINELIRAYEEVQKTQKTVESISEDFSQIQIALPNELARVIEMKLNGFEELKVLVENVSSLNSSYVSKRSELFDNDELDSLIPELEKDLEEIKEPLEAISKVFKFDQLPELNDVEEIHESIKGRNIFSIFKSSFRQAKKKLKALHKHQSIKFDVSAKALPSLISYLELNTNLSSKHQYKDLLGDRFKGIDTDIEELKNIRKWYSQVRKEYGKGFLKRAKLGNETLTLASDTFKALQELSESSMLASIEKILSSTNKMKELFTKREDLFKKSKSLVNEDNVYTTLESHLSKNLNVLQNSYISDEFSLSQLNDLLQESVKFSSDYESWNSSSTGHDLLNGMYPLDPIKDINVSEVLKTIKETVSLASIIEHQLQVKSLKSALKNAGKRESFLEVYQLTEDLRSFRNSCKESHLIFAKQTQLDLDCWFEKTDGSVVSKIKRNKEALVKREWLWNWTSYVQMRVRLGSSGLEPLFNAVEKKKLDNTKLENAFLFSAFDLLSREIIEKYSLCQKYSGLHLKGVREEFKTIDEELHKLQQEKIAYQISCQEIPQGLNASKVGNKTELALLRHEAGKRTRHPSIRSTMKRAGKALIALKPCFMMGPMSVAQYIEPGQVEFDLMVMDEASQVKPEEAIGAMARCKQIIVVGDPKQLPPTSFFDKNVGIEDEDNMAAIEDAESILDAAMPMFKCRRLRWHYRSQHESLIAFSNKYFYENNLVVFPSPHPESNDYGLKFTRVKRGKFVEQKNMEEARVLAEAVRLHLKTKAHESLGVVAMSVKQKEQIERAIEELSKQDTEFQDLLTMSSQNDEAFFVKNLENVQGDERDAIYISCTYGPNEVGAATMPQRFGPINSASGWRRLNVLFTRSKKRMHIFSSMDASHVVTHNDSNRGVVALKQFLEFAQSGGKKLDHAIHTGKGPDSDFEVAVADKLTAAGFKCEYQVGVAGYFIDLAVIDPNKPGRYLMGIECDGATYHSAKSVRDRDRLRQSVLERLGWKIRRIWSTDWFQNPGAELAPLIEELHSLKTEVYEDEVNEAPLFDAFIEEHENEEVVIDNVAHEKLSLREKLLKFDEEVIRPKSNDTDKGKRILRQELLNEFVDTKPRSLDEFQEKIPYYLRSKIAPSERIYLGAILEIIDSE